MNNQTKWRCGDCDSISIEEDLLEATNPFDENMKIVGCPICKNVDGFTQICDEPNCVRDASCGIPTPEGYRRTCGDHMRAAEQKMQPTLDAGGIIPWHDGDELPEDTIRRLRGG